MITSPLPRPSNLPAVSRPASGGLPALLSEHRDKVVSLDQIRTLIVSSKAERSHTITDFVENGAAGPNGDLRKFAGGSGTIQAETAKLLRKLHEQTVFEGGYAFRVYHAQRAALERIRNPGTLLVDFGIQSASTSLKVAQTWSLDHPEDASEKVILILDEDVPKRNIATGFLLDHVVVMPGEVLQVAESLEEAGTTYLLMKSAPAGSQGPVYSFFDGAECADVFQRKSDLQQQTFPS